MQPKKQKLSGIVTQASTVVVKNKQDRYRYRVTLKAAQAGQGDVAAFTDSFDVIEKGDEVTLPQAVLEPAKAGSRFPPTWSVPYGQVAQVQLPSTPTRTLQRTQEVLTKRKQQQRLEADQRDPLHNWGPVKRRKLIEDLGGVAAFWTKCEEPLPPAQAWPGLDEVQTTYLHGVLSAYVGEKLGSMGGLAMSAAERQSFRALHQYLTTQGILDKVPKAVLLGMVRVLQRHVGTAGSIDRALCAHLEDVFEVPGLGAKRLESLLQGLPLTPEVRIRVSLLWTCFQATMQDRHMASVRTQVTRRVADLCRIDQDAADAALQQLAREGRVRVHALLPPPAPSTAAVVDWVWRRTEWNREVAVLHELRRRSHATEPSALWNPTAEQGCDVSTAELSAEQAQAVQNMLRRRLSVVVGGPGCGKTTTLKSLVRVARYCGLKVHLMAPTGAAVNRIRASLGAAALEAATEGPSAVSLSTLHSWTYRRPDDQGAAADAADADKADTATEVPDLTIIDEGSMVDTEVFALFVEKIRRLDVPNVVVLGDTDQLPSVGPGAVLHLLSTCPGIAVTRLTQVFRQQDQNRLKRAITVLREEHRFLADGEGGSLLAPPTPCPPLDTSLQRVRVDALEDAIRWLDGFIATCDTLPLVLAPTNKAVDACQVPLRVRFNTRLASCPAEQQRDLKQLLPGDRVMQTRNVAAAGVFNGMKGYVEETTVSVATGDTMNPDVHVTWDDIPGQRIKYSAYTDTLNTADLKLAWATTIHKAQGMEAEVCIVILAETPGPMCYRNLLYTAISRAQKTCIVVGPDRIVDRMARTPMEARRILTVQSSLAEADALETL